MKHQGVNHNLNKQTMSAIKLAVACLIVSTFSVVPLRSQDTADHSKFTEYKDNYIVTGWTQKVEVEFQVSIKYRLFQADNLFFGYTQRSYWDLWMFKDSSPFRETDYAPEVFYESRSSARKKIIDWVRMGILHESNGKDGPDSRSWNRCYTEIRFNVFDSLLVITPKYWVPFIVEKENGNIDQYLGYGELKIEGSYWKHPDALKLTVLLKKGANLDLRKGGVRLNLTWRPIQSFWPGFTDINPALYVQYWNGTGELLETFNIPTRTLRTGVIFAL